MKLRNKGEKKSKEEERGKNIPGQSANRSIVKKETALISRKKVPKGTKVNLKIKPN